MENLLPTSGILLVVLTIPLILVRIRYSFPVFKLIVIEIPWFLAKFIYNVFWHPLARFPGPLLFATCRIPYVYSAITGEMAHTLHRLHEKHGPIVRTAPNELSFIDASAWDTIYNQRSKGRGVYRKNYDSFSETKNHFTHSIFITDDDSHKRMRKVLNYAFSPQALRNQEPIIQGYIQTLLSSIDQERLKNNGIVDIGKWYDWIALDILADLSFGEPINCLTENKYRPWVHLISSTWKVVTYVSALKSITPSLTLLRFLMPKSIFQKQLTKFNIIIDRVQQRISTAFEPSRPDFLSSIVKHNEIKLDGLSDTEVVSNAALFVTAGTETVATLLSGLTYFLVKNTESMRKLTREVRATFEHESDVTIQTVSHLEYLDACIQEALRLYPPVPEGLPRIVPPEGDTICGQWVPGNVRVPGPTLFTSFTVRADLVQTFVQVSTYAANLSPSNFTSPALFLPERWLLSSRPEFQQDKREACQPFSIGPRKCIAHK
ncbi:hypothetical protein MMC27_002431 [Xylographa pallens]|nr:hypothetical protein [Xylographa pallens]